MNRIIRLIMFALVSVIIVPAQQPETQAVTNTVVQADKAGDQIRPRYVLESGDQIVIRAFQLDEISDKPFRVNSEGDINLPVLGKVHAGGLTVEQLESALLERLKPLVRNPQVSVNVVEFRHETVFLEGAFKTPGLYPLQSHNTLLDVVTASGGLLPNASRKITVTRRLQFGKIPLPTAATDDERKVSSVQISIASLRDNINPREDIALEPMDVINAEPAQMIYVTGEVNKVGGIELGERDWIPVTQLVAMVGGLGKDADPEKARILRPLLNNPKRAEISVNIKRILAGRDIDFPVFPNDMLFVPKNSHKLALGQVGLLAVPMATGLIYVLISKF